MAAYPMQSSHVLALLFFITYIRGVPAAEHTPQALLVLIPDSSLGPGNYSNLQAAIAGQVGEALRVFSMVAEVDWAGNSGNRTELAAAVAVAVQEAVKEATDNGFEPMSATGMTGRIENLYVAMHGDSAAWATDFAMRQAGAAILLGAGLVPQEGVWPSAYEFPRPLMHVFGQLDGVFPLTQASLVALDAVAAAVQLGQRHMAQVRPVAVIQGLNHAQLSDSTADLGAGDLPSDAPQGPLLATAARLVVKFLEANHPHVSLEASGTAVAQLLLATTDAVALLSSFTEVLGRGSLQALFDSNAQDRGESLSAMAPTLFSYGAEMLPPSFLNRAFAAQLGERAAAEQVCISAQRRVLSVLPQDVLDIIQVIATVHTSIDTFLYSQPTVSIKLTASGNKTVVHASCYMFREDLANSNASEFRRPTSPQYYLKLRGPEVVAYALGLDADFGNETLQGADLNRQFYEQALQQVPSLVNETFSLRGTPLIFAPDRVLTYVPPTAWVSSPQTIQYDPDAGTAILTAPSISTLPENTPPFDSGRGRFVGSRYIKCMSMAWMQEWLLITGLGDLSQQYLIEAESA